MIRRSASVLLLTLGVGCGAESPLEPGGGIAILAVVDPSSEVLLVEIRGLGLATAEAEVVLERYRDGVKTVAFGTLRAPGEFFCGPYGGGAFVGSLSCFAIQHPVAPGDSVALSVSTHSLFASGSTTVPGSMRVSAVRSGPDSMTVAWTRSAGAGGYVVSLRREGCLDGDDCRTPLTSIVRDTVAVVGSPPQAAPETLILDVTAFDPHLVEFVESGAPGGLLAVLPISSIRGGWGVVGSTVTASTSLAEVLKSCYVEYGGNVQSGAACGSVRRVP